MHASTEGLLHHTAPRFTRCPGRHQIRPTDAAHGMDQSDAGVRAARVLTGHERYNQRQHGQLNDLRVEHPEDARNDAV